MESSTPNSLSPYLQELNIWVEEIILERRKQDKPKFEMKRIDMKNKSMDELAEEVLKDLVQISKSHPNDHDLGKAIRIYLNIVADHLNLLENGEN